MHGNRWLKREHDATRRLFDQYERVNLLAARRKEDLFLQLRQKLETHARVVREILQAAEEDAAAGALGEAADHVLGTLTRLTNLLDEIALVASGEKQFDSKIHLLREHMDTRVREEEYSLLALAERRLGRKRIRELGARFEGRAERRAAPGADDPAVSAPLQRHVGRRAIA